MKFSRFSNNDDAPPENKLYKVEHTAGGRVCINDYFRKYIPYETYGIKLYKMESCNQSVYILRTKTDEDIVINLIKRTLYIHYFDTSVSVALHNFPKILHESEHAKMKKTYSQENKKLAWFKQGFEGRIGTEMKIVTTNFGKLKNNYCILDYDSGKIFLGVSSSGTI